MKWFFTTSGFDFKIANFPFKGLRSNIVLLEDPSRIFISFFSSERFDLEVFAAMFFFTFKFSIQGFEVDISFFKDLMKHEIKK